MYKKNKLIFMTVAMMLILNACGSSSMQNEETMALQSESEPEPSGSVVEAGTEQGSTEESETVGNIEDYQFSFLKEVDKDNDATHRYLYSLTLPAEYTIYAVEATTADGSTIEFSGKDQYRGIQWKKDKHYALVLDTEEAIVPHQISYKITDCYNENYESCCADIELNTEEAEVCTYTNPVYPGEIIKLGDKYYEYTGYLGTPFPHLSFEGFASNEQSTTSEINTFKAFMKEMADQKAKIQYIDKETRNPISIPDGYSLTYEAESGYEDYELKLSVRDADGNFPPDDMLEIFRNAYISVDGVVYGDYDEAGHSSFYD